MASINSRFEMSIKWTLNGFLLPMLRSSVAQISLREYILKVVMIMKIMTMIMVIKSEKNLDIKSVSRRRIMIQVLRFIHTARARHVT